jgi:hypothetical protein
MNDALRLGRSEPLAYVSVAQSASTNHICVYAYHVAPNTIEKCLEKCIVLSEVSPSFRLPPCESDAIS